MENDLFDLIKEQNGVIIVLKESICKLAQAQVLLQKGIKDRPTVIANLRELDIIDTSLHRIDRMIKRIDREITCIPI